MALPERREQNGLPSPTQADLDAMLVEVERQLERADENENAIERAAQRDQLLELQDWLQAEIDLLSPPSKSS